MYLISNTKILINNFYIISMHIILVTKLIIGVSLLIIDASVFKLIICYPNFHNSLHCLLSYSSYMTKFLNEQCAEYYITSHLINLHI